MHLKQCVQSYMPWALGEVRQAVGVRGVAGVADEAVGLGQRRRPHAAGRPPSTGVRDARAALDAGHRLRDVDHVLVRDEYSRSGTGSLLMSHGVTRRIFFQWTASMSTMSP